MSDVIVVAAIGAIPLTIAAIGSVLAAVNSKRALRETKTNGGGSMKDDLLALKASMLVVREKQHSLHGATASIVTLLASHLTSTTAHDAHTPQTRPAGDVILDELITEIRPRDDPSTR